MKKENKIVLTYLYNGEWKTKEQIYQDLKEKYPDINKDRKVGNFVLKELLKVIKYAPIKGSDIRKEE